MAVVPKNFAGKLITKPGAVVNAKFPQTGAGTGLAVTEVYVVGTASGGVPYNASGIADEDKINVFETQPEIVDALRSGDALTMAAFYMDPSRRLEIPKPTQVKVVVVNPSSQSSTQLLGTDTLAKIDVKSNRFGSYTRQLSLKLVAGTTIGHQVTVKLGTEIVGQRDDVGYESFQIQYTGGGTTALMTINSTGLSINVEPESSSISPSGNPTDDLSLNWTDYPRLDQLIDYINSQPNYICTLLGQPDFPTAQLDAVTNQSVKTAYTHETIVQAVIDFLNNESSDELTATLTSGASRTTLANLANYKFLTGGSDGTATNSDWAAAATLLEKFDVNCILLATGDPTIHAMFELHAREQSAIGVKKRRQIASGASSSKTDSEMLSEMRSLNSALFEYWATPIKRRDPVTGTVTEYAALFGAALGVGIRYGGGGKTAHCILKECNIEGVARRYENKDLTKLMEAGASIIEPKGSVFRVASNPTTLQDQSANLILHYPSGITTTQYIDSLTETTLEDRIASQREAGNEIVINEFINFLLTQHLPRLRDKERVLTDSTRTNQFAFDPNSIKFEFFGDGFKYKFEGTVPLPLAYIFGEHTYRPIQSSATFGTAA